MTVEELEAELARLKAKIAKLYKAYDAWLEADGCYNDELDDMTRAIISLQKEVVEPDMKPVG